MSALVAEGATKQKRGLLAARLAMQELRARHEEEFNTLRGNYREQYGLARETSSKRVPKAVQIARLEKKLSALRSDFPGGY